MLAVTVYGDDGKTVVDWRLCLVPKSDYEIIDTYMPGSLAWDGVYPLKGPVGTVGGVREAWLEYNPLPTHRRLAMIGYVTLGTNDLKRSAAFYDALLADLVPAIPELQRVAHALAACEPEDRRKHWEERFLWAQQNGFWQPIVKQ